MTTPEDFAAACERLVGARINHRGRNRHAVDCVGVLIVAMQDLGVRLEEPASYGRSPDADLLTDYLGRSFRRVAYEDRQRGDVLQVYWGRKARHVAVVTRIEDDASQAVSAIAAMRRVAICPRVRSEVAAVWRFKQWQPYL